MLHTVTKLSEDALGDVGRTLGDEVDTHALGTDQTNHLFDLVEQGFGGAVEEHVGLVEEEHEFRQFHVAHFGQGGVEFGEQPQEECGVKLRLHHQLVGSQHVHHTLSPFGLHQVVDVERGLTEELIGPLVLQLQKGTLDGADSRGGDITIFGGVFLGMFRYPVEHRTQVLQVDQQQPTLIGDAEHDVQYTVLCLVELHQTTQQLRTHL